MSDLFEAFDRSPLTDAEILNYSGPSSKFDINDVELADRMIRSTDLLGKIAEWRTEERQLLGKRNGGRRAYVSDRAILVALLLLAREGRPLLITEMGNLLHKRLTDDARALLELPQHLLPLHAAKDGTEKKNWFNSAYNAFHRMVDVMDPHLDTKKNRNRRTDREYRERIFSARDLNTMRRRKERLNHFTAQLLDMTFRMQPRAIRRRQRKLNLTIDQTPITTLGRNARAKVNRTGPEKGREAVDRMVLDPDLAYYHKGGSLESDAIPAYAANVFVSTADTPGVEPGFPITVRALSLSTPGTDIPEESVGLLEHLVTDLGHAAGRLTSDRGYGASMTDAQWHSHLHRLGFRQVSDWKRDQLGHQKSGDVNGAIFVEGDHYCPAMPQGLIDASKRAEEGNLSEPTYRNMMDERRKWLLRNKEKPAPDGTVKKMCPAYGPQARVACHIREAHPKASKNIRARVTESMAPEHPPTICCQSSAVFRPTEWTRKFSQDLQYGSREWAMQYEYDRNTSEGMHGYLKDDAHVALDAPKRRRAFGLASQQVLVTMLVVSANIRKIATFAAKKVEDDLQKIRERATRRRDREGLSKYKRAWGDPDNELPWDRLISEGYELTKKGAVRKTSVDPPDAPA